MKPVEIDMEVNDANASTDDDVEGFRRVRRVGSVRGEGASAEKEMCCTTTVGISSMYVKAGESVRLSILLSSQLFGTHEALKIA